MDICIDYNEYLQSDKWLKLRERVLTFWNYRCALCNGNEPLQIHHRTYERLTNEILTDLVPLCASCHKKFHGQNKLFNGIEHISSVLYRVRSKVMNGGKSK